MTTSTGHTTDKPMESNDSFYDSIAADYDGLMTDADADARASISRVFCSRVPVGKVLDFGGGTGLDLPWMVANGYTIFSLEPSEGMRAEAIKRAGETDKVKFIADNLDYRQWSGDHMPVIDVIGVLANFAVLNCIEDVHGFFRKIRMPLNDKGKLVLTVIDPSWRNVAEKYSHFVALRLSLRGQLEILRRHNGIYHKTYLYSRRAIREAARGFFALDEIVPIPCSGFVVFIFKPI